jgi:hypothetical protein
MPSDPCDPLSPGRPPGHGGGAAGALPDPHGPAPCRVRTGATLVRLAALLFLLGLTASRVGLVLHELVGHWGIAHAVGCRHLGDVRLFAFGGGYVRYECPRLGAGAALAADVGGIGVELALGALLFAGARRAAGRLAGLAVAAVGLLWVVHGGFYLATGTWAGAGDGRLLYQRLGPARVPFVAAVSALLVAACFGFALDLGRRLAPAVAGVARPLRAAVVVGAILLAGALHGALTEGEQALVADSAYAATFRPEREVRIDAALRRYRAAAPRTAAELATRRAALEARRRPVPLEPVLGAGMAVASLAGLVLALRRAPPDAPALVGGALLARAAGACGLAVALVVALDRML